MGDGWAGARWSPLASVPSQTWNEPSRSLKFHNYGEGPYQGHKDHTGHRDRRVGYHSVLKPPDPYDNCVADPISHLLTVGSMPV